MSEDIQIEQHSFADSGDGEDLYEFTHLSREDLNELYMIVTLSSRPVVDRIRRLQKKLNRFISSLDMPEAS